jgi:hypothetical protein
MGTLVNKERCSTCGGSQWKVRDVTKFQWMTHSAQDCILELLRRIVALEEK